MPTRDDLSWFSPVFVRANHLAPVSQHKMAILVFCLCSSRNTFMIIR